MHWKWPIHQIRPSHLQKLYNIQVSESPYPKKLGCVGLYNDVSKVGNVKKPGQQFDKRDIISAWLNF